MFTTLSPCPSIDQVYEIANSRITWESEFSVTDPAQLKGHSSCHKAEFSAWADTKTKTYCLVNFLYPQNGMFSNGLVAKVHFLKHGLAPMGCWMHRGWEPGLLCPFRENIRSS